MAGTCGENQHESEGI